jgi:hypothetical protein
MRCVRKIAWSFHIYPIPSFGKTSVFKLIPGKKVSPLILLG